MYSRLYFTVLRGLFKSMTQGKGYEPKSDVTPLKIYCFNNRIRVTLKVVITPLQLLFDVAFNVDNRFCVANTHIGIWHQGPNHFQVKVCHVLGSKKGEGDQGE